MASPSSSTSPQLADAPRTEIPLHSVPTAREVLQQFYGTDCHYQSMLKSEKIERDNRSLREVSNQTIDTSLFPYQTEGNIDPPLPTLSEICAARPEPDECDKGEAWRVGAYMVKAAPRVSILQEAENLIYLERHSTVRTPKVYAVFTSDQANPFQWPSFRPGWKSIHYIIMEYIEGATALDLRDEISERTIICWQLGEKIGEQLRRLRAVQPEDPTHFGRIGGRPYQQLFAFNHPPASSASTYGPFKSYEECVTRLIHSAKVSKAISIGGGDYQILNRFMYRDAPSILLEYPKPVDRLPVLSHLDLQDHNMMVKVKRDDKGRIIEIEEVVLIDWSTMCWMPSWYEPGDIGFMVTNKCLDFYRKWANKTLETMGYVNTAIVFFFSMSVHHCFPLEHM